MIEFRNSTLLDIDRMVQIAEDAKALLKSKGVSQWQRGTYPDRDLFLRDAEEKIGYVLAEGNEVLAICAVTFSDEEGYRHLLCGQWNTPNDAMYATIHRSAVAKKQQGKNLSGLLFRQVAKMAKTKGAVSIRIDTHPDNRTMQNALIRAGFKKCGEFLIPDGDEAGDLRFGYELCL